MAKLPSTPPITNISTGVNAIVNMNTGIATVTYPGGSLFYGPLSKEESGELNKLNEEFMEQVKLKRTEAFKALPPELRQMAVNKVLLRKAAREIKSISDTLKKTDRHVDLENKKNAGAVFAAGSYFIDYDAVDDFGLRDHEIIEAHKEACAEEALTHIK